MKEYRKREYRGENRGENLRQAIKHTTLHYLKRMVFSGFLVTALLVVAQLALVFAMFFWLDRYLNIYYEGSVILAMVWTLLIINDDEDPAYKISWIIPILLMPVTGILIYLYLKFNAGTMGIRKVAMEIGKEARRFIHTKESVAEEIKEQHSDFGKLCFYMQKYGNAAVYGNSAMEYLPLGEIAMEAILEELEKAKEFIFVEFFMVEEGIFFDSVLEVLERKVKEGVEVRFMYDDIGCAALLPRHYTDTLKAKGINARTFSRIYPLFSTHYNNRDHRKIIVIDGKVAFTGGINLCDEYINAFEKYGHWKDNAVMVTGEAVKGFTLLFMQTWNSVQYEPGIDYEKYLRICPVERAGYVIPYGDGPYQHETVAENVYLNILHNAKKYVYIMSPYLILDHDIESALTKVAKSGVDVRIILPHIPDKKTPYYVARTYYPKMLAAGVKIYEYKPGFIHSKTFLCDDKIATVGTVNLDFRSLYLHYECGCIFYENQGIMDIREDFVETFKKCIPVNRDYYELIPLWQRLLGRIFRICGPLM